MKKGLPEAVATLVGATIGAGILAVPYFVAKAGLLIGIIDILILGFLILMLNLYVGEISLRTKENHQFIGFAKKYLGEKGFIIAAFVVIAGSYGSLIAYVLASGELMSSVFGLSPILFSILFIIFTSTIIYIGIGAVKRWELWISSGLLIVLLIITAISLPHIRLNNISSINPKLIFMPYGIILFALFGYVAIPEMKEELGKNRKDLKKAIIIGTLIAVAITLIFTIVVVGVVGAEGFEAMQVDQRIATIALGSTIGFYMLVFANLFALCSITTSCLTIGYGLKESYHFDYKFSWLLSWFFVIAIPIIIFIIDSFFFKLTNFMTVVSFTGGIFLSTIGILIVITYIKAKKKGDRKPEFTITDRPWLDYLLIFIFLAGMAYQMITMFI